MRPEDMRRHLEAGGASATSARDGRATTPQSPGDIDAVLASISSSYFRLRRGLAIVAALFPLVLWIGAGIGDLQGSISAYYHFRHGLPATGGYGEGVMRDWFVGVLWTIGSFLFFYKGYDWRENLALNLAGAAAVLISLFPMDWPYTTRISAVGYVHNGSAAVFFLATAYVCLFRSKDTLALIRNTRTRRHFKRIYAALGTLMGVVPLVVYVIHRWVDADRPSIGIFVIEVVAIWVFAGFWWTKSREIRTIERTRTNSLAGSEGVVRGAVRGEPVSP